MAEKKNGRVTTRQLYEAIFGVGERVDSTNARVDAVHARLDERSDALDDKIDDLREATNERLHAFEKRLDNVEGTALPVRLFTRGGRYSAIFGILAVGALIVENILIKFGWPWPF